MVKAKDTSHVDRVVTEADELRERIAKLNAFRGTPTYEGLAGEARELLVQQRDYMQLYLDVLETRIAAEGAE